MLTRLSRNNPVGSCRGRYHTGRQLCRGLVYVPAIAVAGSIGAAVRAGRFGAGACVVRRRRRWHEDAVRATPRPPGASSPAPRSGAGRSPAPNRGPRSEAGPCDCTCTGWPLPDGGFAAANSRPRGRSPRGVQTSQHRRRGHRWPPVAAASPGSLTGNLRQGISWWPCSPPLHRQINPPGAPVRKLDAEQVESMWNLPISGVLRAGLIAAGIMVRVGATVRAGLQG
jgi:hypothetical protein